MASGQSSTGPADTNSACHGISFKEVVEVLSPVCSKWRFIGLMLGVDRGVLSEIQEQYSKRPKDALFEVIEGWLAGEGRCAWEDLVEALRSKSVGENKLARHIEERYCRENTAAQMRSVSTERQYKVTSTSAHLISSQDISSQLPAETVHVASAPIEPGPLVGYSEEDLQARLEDDLQIIQNRFATLLSGTRAALRSKGISPLTVATCAMDLSHVASNKKTSVLNDHKEEIMKSDSIDRLFITLSPFWSFLNYDLLKHIITACGIDPTSVGDYEEALQEFCRRGIIEIPPSSLGSKKGNSLKRDELHIKIDLEHPTLKQVRNAKQKIARILQVEPTALFIHELKPGCVEVEFLVPQCITQLLFPLTDKQKHSLYYQVHVLKLRWKETEIDLKVLFVNEQSTDSEEFGTLPVQDHPKVYDQNQQKEKSKTQKMLSWDEREYQGKRQYGVYHTSGRDILLISSTGVHHTEAVAHTLPLQLSSEERAGYLTSQGVPLDCPLDDLPIMKERFQLDRLYEIAGVEESTSERPLAIGHIKNRIKHLLKNSTKGAVGLYYHGPGKKGTGDWCFADGFITFQDIADMYMESCKGFILGIYADCSYSGSWVKSCGEFLDKQRVQPCGHSARDKKILIILDASCRAKEVAQSLYYSVRMIQNDKNTQKICTKYSQAIDSQHLERLNSTTICCDNKTIDQPCTLPPDLTWQKQLVNDEARDRVHLYLDKADGRYRWQYILLPDDKDIMRAFLKETSSRTTDPMKYGKVLKSGWGEEPPPEVKEWYKKEDFTKYM